MITRLFGKSKNGETEEELTKEKGGIERKELNEMEISNKSEKEFRIRVIQFINQIDEKVNKLYNNQEEIKNDIATIKTI